MSKRFGRNQRRRAREALAIAQQKAERMESAYVMTSGILRDTSERRRVASR